MINPFLRSLELELALVGVWGKSAGQLKAEILDHYQTARDVLRSEGKSESDADKLALHSLGSPRDLAARALAENRIGQSLFAQVVVRIGTFLFLPVSWFLLTFACNRVILVIFWAFISTDNVVDMLRFSHYALFCTLSVAGLVPLVAVFLWIGRKGFNPSRGWNQVLITSGYFALSYSIALFLVQIVQNPTTPAPHGRMTFVAMAGTHALLPVAMILLMPWVIRAWKIKRAQKA